MGERNKDMRFEGRGVYWEIPIGASALLKGGGRYPENEMPEQAVREAGLRHLGNTFRGSCYRIEMSALRRGGTDILETEGEKISIHRRQERREGILLFLLFTD